MSRVHCSPGRGVSLIEAICALGVMAFGMLAVVGVQATLRSNADVSKQRAEATRLAQQGMENVRGFAQLAVDLGTPPAAEYDEIVSAIGAAIGGLNADYTPERTVPADRYPKLKTVVSEVRWVDRAGVTQRVQLYSAIARIAPEVAASLALPQQSGAMLLAVGRNPTIPLQAKDLGSGTSVFVPPQPALGTVAWVFNNFSGLITGVCNVAAGSTTATVLAADVAACSNNTTAQLVSGYVRFASTAVQPLAAESEAPSASVLNLDVVLALTSAGHPAPGATCFDDSTSDAALAAGRQVVTYFCAVFSNIGFTWSGRTRVAPLALGAGVPWVIAAAGAANYKVCRYTTLAGDAGTKNADHPLDYTEAGSKPKASLPNQNFLVISATHTCPTDVAAAGDFVNSNTRLHQDGSATYNNPP